MAGEPRSVPAAGGISYDPLAVKVYERIRERILEAELRPGEQVRIKDLADAFGVSVTPVRDALRRLETDGLVEIAPRRGAFVRVITSEQVIETFHIRRIVECASLREVDRPSDSFLEHMREILAEMDSLRSGSTFTDYKQFVSLDRSFHGSIVDLAGSRLLSEFYQNLRWAVQPALVLARSREQRAAETVAEHRAILRAIEAGNQDKAAREIDRHLGNAQRDLLSHLAGASGASGGKHRPARSPARRLRTARRSTAAGSSGPE